jgi:hypothetical protein
MIVHSSTYNLVCSVEVELNPVMIEIDVFGVWNKRVKDKSIILESYKFD